MVDAETGPPNVLCISVDSLRADFTSVFNENETTTPFLESLDGTVYTNAITPSCWTLQVHASIFTGLYPPEHRVLDKDRTLGSRETFAEILDQRGYDTKSFGYNGWLQAGDVLRGFDHTSTKKVTESSTGKIVKKLKHALFVHQIRDEFTIENCIQELERTTDPFCHFVHLDDAHYIYTPPRPYNRNYTDAHPLSLTVNLLQQRRLYDSRGEVYVGDYWPSERSVEIMKDLYRGCIRMEDDLIKRLFESLRENGQLENTLVIIFGDHGDNFGEDGIYGHQFSVADSLIRVPLIVHDPTGRFPEGRRSELAQLNDLFPTILEYCGCAPPESHSVSLLGDATRDAAYTYYSVADSFVERLRASIDVAELPPRKQYAIWKSPDEKAVYFPEEERWAEGSPDEELQAQLLEHLAGLHEYDVDHGVDVDAAVRENLEQMGYL